MDIWSTYCNKTVTCRWCKEPIKLKDRMFKGRNKYKRNDRTFTSYWSWHFDCYVIEATYSLDNREYKPQPGGPGRKSMKITGVDWKRRQKLMLRARTIKKFIADRVRLTLGQDMDRDPLIPGYRQEILDLHKELELVGGIPTNWR